MSRFSNSSMDPFRPGTLYLALPSRPLAQWLQLLDIAEKVSMASPKACLPVSLPILSVRGETS
jgi:hypothetical protein